MRRLAIGFRPLRLILGRGLLGRFVVTTRVLEPYGTEAQRDTDDRRKAISESFDILG